MSGNSTTYAAVMLCAIGIALVAIGFGTANWREFRVRRDILRQRIIASGTASKVTATDLQENYIFFTRIQGFFHVCFENNLMPRGENITLQKTPLGQQCIDTKYDDNLDPRSSDDQILSFHLKRAYLGLYVAGLAFCFLSILTLLVGCFKSSHSLVTATAVFLLLAGSLIAASIGCWHKYIELDEGHLTGTTNYLSWPIELKDATARTYGWSYIVSWIGVGFLLISSIVMFAAGGILRNEKFTEEDDESEKEIIDNRALVPAPGMYAQYDKNSASSGLYASPYAAAGGNYGAYMNYGYGTYNPYSYYYPSYPYYYPYYTMR